MIDSWKTGNSGDWNGAGNWTGGVPDMEFGDATISVPGAYTVAIAPDESLQANSLTLDDNTATLGLAGQLELAGSSTFANGVVDLTGVLYVDGSATLQAGLLDVAGDLGGQGSLELDGGTMVLNGGTLDIPTIALAGADMVLKSDLDFGGSFVESSGTLDLNGFNATLSGTSQLGTGIDTFDTISDTISFAAITGPGNVDVTNFAQVNSIFLSNGAVLQDNGIIVDTGYLYLGGYNNAFYGNPTDSASMSISSGAVFDFAASSMPDEYQQFPISYFKGPASSIVNAGLFEMMTPGHNPILPSFDNLSTGTVSVAAGADFDFSGGGTFAGHIKGAGEIDFTGGTFALTPGLVIGTSTFGLYGDAFQDSVLQLNGSAVLKGTVVFGGGDNGLDGAADATITGHGTLDTSGKATINSLDLTGGAMLEDIGTITLDGNLDFGDDSEFENGTGSPVAILSIASSGVFNIAAGGAIDDYDFYNDVPKAARIINSGLFELTAGSSVSEEDALFINTGTVAVDTGTLLLTTISGGAAGTLHGGTWDVTSTNSAGATLELQTPVAIKTDNAHIILSGSGSEFMSGPTEATTLEQSLVSVASTGVLSLLKTRGFDATGNINDSGTILLQGGAFTTPLLNVTTHGTFDGFGTIAGSVNNSGTIEATNSKLTITGNVSGKGDLRIDAHTKLLLEAGVKKSAEITFGGTLSVLGLEAPGSFFGTLAGFSASDTIELTGISAITHENFSDGVLTLTDAGGTIGLTFANPATLSSGFVITSTGGNTSITVAAAPAGGTVSAVRSLATSEMTFLRPAATGSGASVSGSDVTFLQQLPVELFLMGQQTLSTGSSAVGVSDGSTLTSAANISDLMTSKPHADSLLLAFTKQA